MYIIPRMIRCTLKSMRWMNHLSRCTVAEHRRSYEVDAARDGYVIFSNFPRVCTTAIPTKLWDDLVMRYCFASPKDAALPKRDGRDPFLDFSPATRSNRHLTARIISITPCAIRAASSTFEFSVVANLIIERRPRIVLICISAWLFG